MGRKKKLDTDGWGNPLPKIKKTIKKKKKKEEESVLNNKFSEELTIESPSMSFCISCKNSNIRAIKDKLNEAVILIKSIAEELGIEGEKYEGIKKDLIEWVRKERNKREERIKKIKKDKK